MSVSESEQAIRDYLQFLKDPSGLVDHAAIDAIKREIQGGLDPIEELRQWSRLEQLERPRGDDLRERFAKHAKSWADQNGVTANAFTAMGVPTEALREAGLVAGRGRGRTEGGSKPRATRRNTSSAAIKAEALRMSGEFSLSDVAAQAGGSPMTVRKAVTDLVDSGELTRVGPDPKWSGQGRAPILYRRAG